MRANRMSVVVVALAAVGLAALSGCAPQCGQISAGEATLPKDGGSAGFLDRISSQKTVSENDAMRGLLMLLDGDDSAETFRQRVEKLRARNVVADEWSCDAGRDVTRGRLAYMIYQACDITGGLTLHLAGPSQRYCLRELQYQGFISPRATLAAAVTGMELVGVLNRADAFMETGEVPDVISNRISE